MSEKHISGRQLRHDAHEETLAPGETIIVKKRDGKIFEMKRVDSGPKNINAGLDRLLAEMPPEGSREQTNLASIIIEDRG